MAKRKEKGFDLGKSNEPTPGFELNKKGGKDAPGNTGEGFALGKGKDEKIPAFDLGKGEQGITAKPNKKGKETKEVSPSDNATSSKKKSVEKVSKEKVQKAPVKVGSKTSNEGSSTSTSDEAIASKKRSKVPLLIGVLAAVLIGLYFFIPASVDDKTMHDNSVSEDVASQTEIQEDAVSPTEIQEDQSLEDSESNLSSTEQDLEPEILEGTSSVVNDAAVSVSSNSGSFSFGKNSTSVSISNNQLNDLLSYLEENSRNSIVIEGHSSSEGDNFYNIGLSKRRAEAVKAELVLNGLSSDRILTVAKGSEFPIADNSTESGRAKNRRVEIKVN